MLQFASELRREPTLSPSATEDNSVDLQVKVSSQTLYQLTSIAQEFDEIANTCLLLLHLEVNLFMKRKLFYF